MKFSQIGFVDTGRALDVEIRKKSVHVACDAILFRSHTEKTEYRNLSSLDIESDTLICFILDVINLVQNSVLCV